ncbi:MAG: hypothetical protein NC184_03625 [Roseburia sp.]|nr:hypothetical protein [Roseburia sp.]
MKTNVKNTIDKLLAYAADNLMLDALDKTYTLNRLSAVCGVALPESTDEADYGDATLDSLLSELAAALPDIDKRAVADMLMPLPHTVNQYFNDELNRNVGKARDFLFELHALGGYASSDGAHGCDGYSYRAAYDGDTRSAFLPVGDELKYTPVAVGGKVARLECPDVFIADILARELAYAEKYGGAIAKRIGGDAAEYLCCDGCALSSAKVKKQLSDGAVKTALLDYPVPVLAFSGIAKNSVMQTAARIVKHAVDAGIDCVCAASAQEKNGGVTFYAVFAKPEMTDGDGVLAKNTDALTPCGVFETIDFEPLLPVLEKGVALSTDLFMFKPIYSSIGGVKHGQKAREALDGAVVALFKTALEKSASCNEARATALVDEK